MDLQLAGKKALVTGSTRGIGIAIAERLALDGADVAICARDGGAVEATIESLQSKRAKAWGQSIDVADAAALRSWVEDAASALGGIDILVVNASALSFGSGIEALRSAFDVDLFHSMNAVEVAMPSLERSPSASIVAIGSIGGVEVSELTLIQKYLMAPRRPRCTSTSSSSHGMSRRREFQPMWSVPARPLSMVVLGIASKANSPSGFIVPSL